MNNQIEQMMQINQFGEMGQINNQMGEMIQINQSE